MVRRWKWIRKVKVSGVEEDGRRGQEEGKERGRKGKAGEWKGMTSNFSHSSFSFLYKYLVCLLR